MKTARRFVNEESGMALPLAVIMIVLLGVMGAGLLTFVSRDLNTVVEQNRGQRAFELADAGVGVAKRQLTDDCAGDILCTDSYDAAIDELGNYKDLTAPDIQWSWLEGGVTLEDLDGDGNVTTVDKVHVAIDFQANKNRFKVISTGTYGEPPRESKRKIEAILQGVGGSFGGEGIGHPIYYTPSDITIEGDPENEIQMQGISMFTKGDIIMEGYNGGIAAGSGCSKGDPVNAPFKTDYENTNCGIFHIPNPKDQLGDWDSRKFQTSPGNWNTQGRLSYPEKNGKKSAYTLPGFAAEGRICGVPTGSEIGECRDPTDPTGATPLPSIADGVYGFDCTTGTVDVLDVELCPDGGELPRGNQWTFMEKEQVLDEATDKMIYPDNEPGTITYPFPLLQPKEKRLALVAQEQEDEGGGGDYYRGCSPPWETMLADATAESVFFIDLGDCVDANGDPIPVDMTFGGTKDGIMVVWCGDLHHTNDTKYRGILMNLTGNGSTFGSSNCEEGAVDANGDLMTADDTMKRGVYRLDDGSEMFGWLYSEGGTPERSGIELAAGTILHFRSGASWNFLDDILSGTPPTAFSVRGWRECYELEEDAIENTRVC
jgi:hypothetical protein